MTDRDIPSFIKDLDSLRSPYPTEYDMNGLVKVSLLKSGPGIYGKLIDAAAPLEYDEDGGSTIDSRRRRFATAQRFYHLTQEAFPKQYPSPETIQLVSQRIYLLSSEHERIVAIQEFTNTVFPPQPRRH